MFKPLPDGSSPFSTLIYQVLTLGSFGLLAAVAAIVLHFL